MGTKSPTNGWSLFEPMLGVRVTVDPFLEGCRSMPKVASIWSYLDHGLAGKKEHFFAVPPVQCSLFRNSLLFCAANFELRIQRLKKRDENRPS